MPNLCTSDRVEILKMLKRHEAFYSVSKHFAGLEVLELTKFQATKEKELEGRDASFLQCQVNGEGRRRW